MKRGSMKDTSTLDADVIVVGAGFGGLYAAWELHKAGVDVMVVEGRNRVGGRVDTIEVQGAVIDTGGSWIGPGQDTMFALAKELGVDTVPYNDNGKTVMDMNGRIRRYSGLIPPLSPIPLIALHMAMSKLDKLCASIDHAAPNTHPRARELDSMTMATWVQRHVWTSTARKLFKIALDGIFAVDMAEYSVCGAAVLLAGVGGITGATDAQTHRLSGGAHSLATGLAAQLGEKRVLLGKEVTAIAQEEDTAVVSGDGWALRCRHVIVAMSPSLSQRLHYSPHLSSTRDLLCQRMPMGSVWKLHVIYKSAWWREAGLCGTVVSDGQTVSTMVDVGPPEGAPGVLAAFAVTDNARRLSGMSQEQRKSAFVEFLVRVFGSQASAVEAYHEMNWSREPFSRGCYSAVPSPGCLTSLGDALTKSFGRIHWAGTECASEYWGYMEGACRSGRQVAKQVQAALQNQ